MKAFDPNKIKTDEKSSKNLFIYYLKYVKIKDLKNLENYSGNPLHLIISKFNGFFEEINKNTYLMLLPTNESKEIIKFEEL